MAVPAVSDNTSDSPGLVKGGGTRVVWVGRQKGLEIQMAVCVNPQGKQRKKQKHTPTYYLISLRLIPATFSSPPGMLRFAGLEMVTPEVLEY